MGELIESNTLLRRALRPSTLRTLLSLDPRGENRRAGSALRREILGKFPSACARCGFRKRVELAHLVPVEMAGGSEHANVLLLCHACHRRFDSGYASIAEMTRVARKWRDLGRPVHPGSPLRARTTPESEVTNAPEGLQAVVARMRVAQRQLHYGKAESELKNALRDHAGQAAQESYLLIRLGELERRRARKGALPKALRYLDRVPSDLPEPLLSARIYELAMVYRQLGKHARALDVIEGAVASSATVERLTRQNQQGICELAVRGVASDLIDRLRTMWREWQNELEKKDGYWAGRWKYTCVRNIARLELAASDWTRARRQIALCEDFLLSRDNTNGWARLQRAEHGLLVAYLAVHDAPSTHELLRSVQRLSRVFFTTISQHRRFDGIRDVMKGLSHGLRALHSRDALHAAEDLDRVFPSVQDGFAFINPYRDIT